MALIKCKNCGQPVSADVERCPNCGASLQSRVVKQKETTAKRQVVPKRRRRTPRILIVLVVVLILGILFRIVMVLSEPRKYPMRSGQTHTITSEEQRQTPLKSRTYERQGQIGEPSGEINGHEYVDLGLSVKWATCNVGASSPSDYGDYYAWGEVFPKEKYTQENCVTFRQRLDDIAGDSRYDAARANWGGSWRLPTAMEMDELKNACRLERVRIGLQEGLSVTGPNGNSIFLPAGGRCDGMAILQMGEWGFYWSSVPKEGSPGWQAYSMTVLTYTITNEWNMRHFGMNVRPVSK